MKSLFRGFSNLFWWRAQAWITCLSLHPEWQIITQLYIYRCKRNACCFGCSPEIVAKNTGTMLKCFSTSPKQWFAYLSGRHHGEHTDLCVCFFSWAPVLRHQTLITVQKNKKKQCLVLDTWDSYFNAKYTQGNLKIFDYVFGTRQTLGVK